MKFLRSISIVTLLAAVVLLGSCNKKKPNVPPPQAQAPTISQPAPATQAQPAPPPPVNEEPARPQPEAQPPAPAEQPAATEAPKPKPKHSRAAKKTTPPTKSASVQPPPPAPAPAPPPQLQTVEPSHTVVQQGGAPPQNPPQLSASMSHDAAIHQRMTTAQLQEATEYNLKSISRALNSDEQAMVEHIRSYMQQSRSASADGDMDRAYNLAMKAHLLSDELVKR